MLILIWRDVCRDDDIFAIPHDDSLVEPIESPLARSALLDAWMSSCFLSRNAPLMCRFDSVAGMDDLSSSDFSTYYILDATLGHIPHLDRGL